MSEVKFTPGPWEFYGRVDDNDQPTIMGPDFEIATLWHHCVGSIEKEAHANAHLIAAAPELYEALEFMANCFEWGCVPTGKERAIKDARAALAKARGES